MPQVLQDINFPIQFGGLDTTSPASMVYPHSPDMQNVRFGRKQELLKRTGFTTYNATRMPDAGSNFLPVFVNAATTSGIITSSSNTITLTKTISAGVSRLLVAMFYMRTVSGNTATEVTSMSFEGVALTRQSFTGATGVHRLELWSLVAPTEVTSGTLTVTITAQTGTQEITYTLGANNYTRVHQTTPFGTAVTGSGSSTTPSVTVSSATNELVIDAMGYNIADQAETVGAGQTERFDIASGGGVPTNLLNSDETGAASTVMDWTLGTAASWRMIGLPIRPASEVFTNIFQFNRRDTTTRYTIVCTPTRIFRVPTSGAWVELASGLGATATDYWSAAVFNNEMILANGVSTPQITDGTAAGTTALVQSSAMQARTAMLTAMHMYYKAHSTPLIPGLITALAGATSSSTYDSATQKYDPVGDAWKAVTRSIIGRNDGAGFAAYERSYITTGLSAAATFTATTEFYNPVTDTWTGVTNITASRRQVPGFSVNNRGYVITGNSDAGAAGWSTTNYGYDPATDVWTTNTAIGSGRREAAGFSVSQMAHVASGRVTTTDAYVTTHDEYNPFTDAYTSLTAITASRSAGGGGRAGVNNLGYVMGGTDSAGARSATIYSYNRSTDAWTTSAAALTTAKEGCGVAPDDHFMYAIGGLAAGTTINGQVDRLNLSPAAPVAFYVLSYAGQLFLARTTAFPSRVFYAPVGESRQWPVFNFFDVNPDDGNWITGMFVFQGRMYVMKTDGLYQVQGGAFHPAKNPPEYVQVGHIPGTRSSRSIVVTEGGVFYLSEDGFRWFDGSDSNVISRPIQATLDTYTDARMKYVAATWVRARDEVWFAHTSTGTVHNRVFVYNYRFNAWTIFVMTVESVGIVEDANDIDQVLFGNSHDGLLYLADSGNSDNGAAIDGYYRTGWFSPASIAWEFRGRFLFLAATRSGNWSLSLDAYRDYGTTSIQTDTINLSTANAYFQDTVTLRARVPLDIDGHALQLRFRNANAGEPFEIHQAVLLGHKKSISGLPK